MDCNLKKLDPMFLSLAPLVSCGKLLLQSHQEFCGWKNVARDAASCVCS